MMMVWEGESIGPWFDVHGKGGGGKGKLGNLPCDLSHDKCDVPIPPPEQTDACENFTFPQLSLHAITKIYKNISYKLIVTTIIETKSILTSIVDNVFFSFQTKMEVVGSSGKYR